MNDLDMGGTAELFDDHVTWLVNDLRDKKPKWSRNSRESLDNIIWLLDYGEWLSEELKILTIKDLKLLCYTGDKNVYGNQTIYSVSYKDKEVLRVEMTPDIDQDHWILKNYVAGFWEDEIRHNNFCLDNSQKGQRLFDFMK